MVPSSDILVVGSGIIGCAVAYELGRRGLSVRVLDDRPPGSGATRASAGMLAPYNEIDEEGAHLELTLQALARFDPFMARLNADSGGDVQYHRNGTLTLAFTDEVRDRLARLVPLVTSRAVPATLLDADAVADAEPAVSPTVLGGLLIPSHGFVAAGELTQALVAAASRFGAIFEAVPRVREIHVHHHGLSVTNGRDRFAADTVINAAGSWSGTVRLAGADAVPVEPVRGQLLQLKCADANLRRVTWGDGCYLVPWDDGSLLVGATVERVGFDEHTTIGGLRELCDALTRTLRPDWRATVVGARAGLRPGTPDDMPIIGRSAVSPKVLYATGHYRNGVLLAPVTADLVAGLVMNEAADPLLDATRPGRFGHL